MSNFRGKLLNTPPDLSRKHPISRSISAPAEHQLKSFAAKNARGMRRHQTTSAIFMEKAHSMLNAVYRQIHFGPTSKHTINTPSDRKINGSLNNYFETARGSQINISKIIEKL